LNNEAPEEKKERLKELSERYVIVHKAMSWRDARMWCHSMEGELAAFRDEVEW